MNVRTRNAISRRARFVDMVASRRLVLDLGMGWLRA
jgi:hypothetical protein